MGPERILEDAVAPQLYTMPLRFPCPETGHCVIQLVIIRDLLGLVQLKDVKCVTGQTGGASLDD